MARTLVCLWRGEGRRPQYRALINQFIRELKAVRADDLLLINEVDFFDTFSSMVLSVALSDKPRNTNAGEQRVAPPARERGDSDAR